VVGAAYTRQQEGAVQFADVFALSHDALILRQRRFLNVADWPGGAGPS